MKKILQKISKMLVLVPAMVMSFGLVATVSMAPAMAASGCDVSSGIGGAVNEGCSKGSGQQTDLFGNEGVFTTIINVMLFIVGILCIIMIIYGGIRYTTSNGDKGRVESAKNTILYAVVGLIIAILAFALVSWVVSSLGAQESA